MARAYTTLFSYYGRSYTAVVSEVQDEVKIFVPDDSLHEVLPNGRASISRKKGLPVSTPRLSLLQNLVLNILASAEAQKSASLHRLA